jgi:lipoprotein NlpI
MAVFIREINAPRTKNEVLKYLVNSTCWDIVTRDQLQRIIREQNLQFSDRFDPNTAVKYGKLFGVDAIVDMFLKYDSDYGGIEYNFKIFNVKTGKILVLDHGDKKGSGYQYLAIPIVRHFLPHKKIKGWTRFITCQQISTQSTYRLAVESYKKGKYADAIAGLSKIIAENPNLIAPLISRSYSYMRQGETDLAMIDVNKALEINPNEINALIQRGWIYLGRQENQKAFSDFEKASELDPKNASGFWGKGQVYFNNGEFIKAVDNYSIALDINNNDKYLHIMKYLAIKRAGITEMGELKKYSDNLKSEDWITPVIRMFTGEITPETCLYTARDSDKSKDREQKCEAYYFIGQYFLLNSKKSEAKKYFKKCVETGVIWFIEHSSAIVELNRL